jgi:hypothetical protein
MSEKHHFAKGLDGRMRDKNGEIRKKRGDTQITTLRDEYGQTFAPGYPPEATLGMVLEAEGLESLDQLLKKKATRPDQQ